MTWTVGASLYARLSLRYPSSAVNVSRALVGLSLFLVWVLFREGGVDGAVRAFAEIGAAKAGWLVVSIFASYAFGDVLFFWSTRVLGVASAMAIASTYPVWSALTGVFFRGETMHWMQALGLVVVVLGTILVIVAAPSRVSGEVAAHDTVAPRFVRTKRAGVLLALATSLCWTLNTWALAHGGAEVHPSVGNSLRMASALLLCPLVGYLLRGPTFRWWLGKEDFRKALPVFVFEGFGGTVVFFYGMTHSSLAVAATLSSLSPVLAYGYGLARKTEKADLRRGLGIVLVVAGLAALLGLG